MTIICVDRHLMVADGQVSCDGIIITRAAKKIVKVQGPNGPALCALTGTTLFETPAIRWYERGANPEDAPKGDSNNPWHLVAVDQHGAWVFDWDSHHPDYYPAPWAWGVNHEFAIGLMTAGKSAAEAVAVMCERSTGVGGEIQVVNIAEALGLQTIREAAE